MLVSWVCHAFLCHMFLVLLWSIGSWSGRTSRRPETIEKMENRIKYKKLNKNHYPLYYPNEDDLNGQNWQPFQLTTETPKWKCISDATIVKKYTRILSTDSMSILGSICFNGAIDNPATIITRHIKWFHPSARVSDIWATMRRHWVKSGKLLSLYKCNWNGLSAITYTNIRKDSSKEQKHHSWFLLQNVVFRKCHP